MKAELKDGKLILPGSVFSDPFFDTFPASKVVLKHVERDEFSVDETTFSLHFTDDRGAGYSFDCDSAGQVDQSKLSDAGLNSFRDALSRDWPSISIWPRTITFRLCPCGSGLEAHREYDAQGIYLCMTCKECRKKKLAGYRREILTGYTQADVDEPIEAEE